MQSLYRLDCATRFDAQCTNVFMVHLQQIRYHAEVETIILAFHPEHLDVQGHAVRRMIPYNNELKDALSSSAIEYGKVDDGHVWSIEIIWPGYFRENIQLQGSDDKPNTYKFFQAFIDELTKTL